MDYGAGTWVMDEMQTADLDDSGWMSRPTRLCCWRAGRASDRESISCRCLADKLNDETYHFFENERRLSPTSCSRIAMPSTATHRCTTGCQCSPRHHGDRFRRHRARTTGVRHRVRSMENPSRAQLLRGSSCSASARPGRYAISGARACDPALNVSCEEGTCSALSLTRAERRPLPDSERRERVCRFSGPALRRAGGKRLHCLASADPHHGLGWLGRPIFQTPG